MAGSGKELVPIARPTGRPKGSGSLYSEEVAEEICERLIDGETLVWLCKYDRDGNVRERGTFPNHATVADWADPKDGTYIPDFGPRFARARIAQHENWIQSTVDIARRPHVGLEETVEHSDRLGVTVRRARKDMLGHRALLIDTLHKAAARLDPQKWEARLQQAAPPEQDPNAQPPKMVIEGGFPEERPVPPRPDYMGDEQGPSDPPPGPEDAPK